MTLFSFYAQPSCTPGRAAMQTGGYKTFFSGKWHLGEADYALPNAQGYDEMKYAGLYHLNAYTYADPTWFPDMDPELRAMFQRVTKGALSGNAGQPAREEFKINGQYVDTPLIDGREGVVGIARTLLHEHQLHEGSPAEHAAPRLHP